MLYLSQLQMKAKYTQNLKDFPSIDNVDGDEEEETNAHSTAQSIVKLDRFCPTASRDTELHASKR